MRKLKKRKDKAAGEMIKGGCDIGVDWIWRLCNMVFESGDVSGGYRYAVNIQLYKGKRENIECRNYGDIGLLSVDGKNIRKNIVDRVRRVTEGFIDDE